MRKSGKVIFILLISFLFAGSACGADTTVFETDFYIQSLPTNDYETVHLMETYTDSNKGYLQVSTRDHVMLVHQIEVGSPEYWFINSALQITKTPADADYKELWGTSAIPNFVSANGFQMSGVASHLKKVSNLAIGFEVVRTDGTRVVYNMADCVYVCTINGQPCLVIYNEAAYRQNSAGGSYQWFGGVSYTNVKGQQMQASSFDKRYIGGTGADWQVFDAQYYSSSQAARTWKYKTTVAYTHWYLTSTHSTIHLLPYLSGGAGYKVSLDVTGDGELLHLKVDSDKTTSDGTNPYLEEDGKVAVGTWYQQKMVDGINVPVNPYYPPTIGSVTSNPLVEYNEYFPTKVYLDGSEYAKYKYVGYLQDNRFDRRYTFYIESIGDNWYVSWNTGSSSASAPYYTGSAYDILDYVPEPEEPEQPIEPDKPDINPKPPIVDGSGLPNLGFYPQIDVEFGVELTGGFQQYFSNEYFGVSSVYHTVKQSIDSFFKQIMEIPFYALKVHLFDYEVNIQVYTGYIVTVKEDYAVPFYNLGISLSKFVPGIVWFMACILFFIFSIVAVIELFTGKFSEFIRRRLL